MKTKLMVLLIIISSLSEANHNCAQAQNSPSSMQEVAMLKKFYTIYITEWSKLTSPADLTKLDLVQKKYCTPSLLSKIKSQIKNGYMEADPFVQAQDVDISWLKTMSFKKNQKY